MATKSVQQQGSGAPSSQQGAAASQGSSGIVQRSDSSGLHDVLELILDRGLVIDIFLRVSLIGIEVVTVDARIVLASVDTYLRFAEAVNRLDLSEQSQGLPEMVDGAQEGGAKKKTKGALEGAKEAFADGDSGRRREKQHAGRHRGDRK